MRKLDILVLKSFFGPFILTTAVATFILLIQYMLKYFDDFVGKDLGFSVFAELLFYFSLNMLQVALPLGVLVSSLMTFGNLGEHFELTAIKGAGISLLRAMQPIFFFVVILTYAAFLFNNHIVPAANLKAYSLLYDIKHKKPALDIKEGVFYNGIPDYSIKVREKLGDGKTLKDVMIYDHTDGSGNRRVILSDSSRMYTILNDKYLKLELFNGNYYNEQPVSREPVDQFYRTNFKRMDMVFNLSSFDLKRTREELFQNNRQMQNVDELTVQIDSMYQAQELGKTDFVINARSYFYYHLNDRLEHRKPVIESAEKQDDSLRNEIAGRNSSLSQVNAERRIRERPISLAGNPQPGEDTAGEEVSLGDTIASADTLNAGDSVRVAEIVQPRVDTMSWAFLDSRVKPRMDDILTSAKNQAQNVKVNLGSAANNMDKLKRDTNKFVIEKYKKYSQAVACLVMFLIGAPLGAIIKKGGLGVPVIVSVFFFIVYYVLTAFSEKGAKEGLIDPVVAVWVADVSLFPAGLFFLRQARIDARLFDVDFYHIWIDRILSRFKKVELQ